MSVPATPREALLNFTSLYEIAGMGADVYGEQDALIAACRSRRQRFMAVMPLRCRVRCPECGVDTGESIVHLEDPAQAPGKPLSDAVWHTESGRYVEVKHSELHALIAHGRASSPALGELLAQAAAGSADA